MSESVVTGAEGIRERLISFIVENFLFGDEARKPADGASLIGTGTLDSTGILELIQFLEQSFAILVEDTETVPENLDSIDAIVRFVRRKQDHVGT